MKKQTSPYYSLKSIERILSTKREKIKNIAKHAGAHYSPYDVEQIKEKEIKINGEIKIEKIVKLRHIDNPDEELKFLQRKILKNILLKQMLSLPDGMIGGVAGKSIKDNARPHINQEMVVTIDIKDCFPSTTNIVIHRVWRNIGCSTIIAGLFTQLTTFRTVLPQGAPTSSALCNLTLLPLYNDIRTFAVMNNIAFTLYVDDITLSGKVDSVLPAIGIVIKKIQKYGFGVRREKIGIMPANITQKVTGLNTNKKVNIAQRKIEAARNKILTIAKRGTGITKNEFNSINGTIHFVKSVSKEKASKLKDFADMLLPENIIAGEKTIKLVTRPCRHHKRSK